MSTPTSDKSPLIDIAGLSVSFDVNRRHVDAVTDVNLVVYPGESVAIVGESGSGKSVTARTLVGLTGRGSRVQADRFQIAGRDARDFTDREWRKVRGGTFGLVLQDALVSLDPLRTIGAEISEVLRAHRIVPRKEEKQRARELLAQVGIPDPEVRARQYAHELSGGLRQRALIASAIAGDPALIIADEPTTALDVTVQAQVLRVLDERRRAGSALLLISHDLAVVANTAQRVIVMRDGVIVEEGPTEQVLLHPEHPYTRALLAAVPSAATRGRRLSGRVGEELPKSAIVRDEVLLEASHVSKSFSLPGGRTLAAVNDVSVKLARGEKVGIVGESGSGKSTLARLILGLLPVDAGEIFVGGNAWGAAKGKAGVDIRRRVQFVSQDPFGSFDPRYVVADVIAEPLRGTGLTQSQLAHQVRRLLLSVGLDADLVNVHPRTLSGGQRQRVSIARALALKPDVLVCDEPVSALDVSVQAQVLDLLADLSAETGASLIFISHDLGVVHHLVDRVLVMSQGEVVEEGDVNQVFIHPSHPYTQALVAAVPRLDQESAVQ